MFDVEFVEEIDSTSAYARRNLVDLPNFKVISANVQTDGHGQFGRKWLSSAENGGNCYISIVLKPENIEHLNELTRFTSLMTAKTLAEYDLKAELKYPNDVLVNGKKIAGILAESVFMGTTFKGVIVGIGVNLNLGKSEVDTLDIEATSIYLETGKNIDKKVFIGKLLEKFAQNYAEFLEHGIKA